MELLKVIYIGRHGQREPTEVPEAYKQDWPNKGELTLKGAEGQYTKGTQMRTKYSEFFKLLQDSPKYIFCRTSDFGRNVDSAHYFLSGLFNLPFVFPITAGEEKFKVIRKYGNRLSKLACDVLYRSYFVTSSPAFASLYSSMHKAAEEKKEYFTELEPVVHKLKSTYGLNSVVMDYRGFFHLNDFLECYKANDKPLPKEFTEADIKATSAMPYFTLYNITLAHETIRRVYNHYLFKELIKVINEPSRPFFYYFSGHYITMFAFLLGLGYVLPELTNYNTGITIEVYKGTKGRFINIEYDEKNINKLLFPELSSDYIPIEVLLEAMQKEKFKSDDEYKLYSGNKEFDYDRDFEESEIFN